MAAADDPDAVVIGAGPNGLVAANLLADAGWRVLVLEEQPEPGGSVRTVAGPAPGFVSDVCSAFYPLAAASPAIASLGLAEFGLRWEHAPAVLAHVFAGDRSAVLYRDASRTAAGLAEFGSFSGDGEAWLRLSRQWDRVGDAVMGALFTPFPPLRSGLSLLARLGLPGLLRLGRFGLLPVRRLAAEEFAGPAGPLLLAGCALHTDLAPESTGSTVYGWLLAMLGQRYGFPVPRGGAGELTGALVRRLSSRGGSVRCGDAVRRVVVRGGRCVGVVTSSGLQVGARRAVLADVPAVQLYGGLVDWSHLPARLRDDIRRFDWDYATVKVDYALSGPMPWAAAGAREAGTVHVAADLDEMTRYVVDLATGQLPSRPFLLVGQMTTSDPSRSPAGTESLWAYTHVPHRVWAPGELDGFVDTIEAQLERFAPGWRELVIARSVWGPGELAAHNSSLVGGAINGGTAAAHQQLLFRPTPGLGRPETPVAGLYLASSSAHPGGGVHGACGANAARAALRASRTGAQRVGAWAARAAIGR